ncbi:MAG: hypothetical protein ACOH14_10485 [Rhodoglobus sp.]
MRLPNLVRVSGGALLLALLSGCVPSDAATSPDPTPTFVAPYATDEEALEAAEAAYAEYVRVINFHLHEGVVDNGLLAAVAVGAELDGLIESHTRLSQNGTRSVGDVKFDDVTLQRYSKDGSHHEIIVIYVCENLSGVYLVGPDGERIVEDDFGTELVQVTFDLTDDQNFLLVSDRNPWGESC